VRRTFVVCDEVLARAGLRARDLAEVFAAGGTCRIPHIQTSLQHYFGRAPRVDRAPETMVALGAALIAHETVHEREQAAKQTAEYPVKRSAPRVGVSLRVDVELVGGKHLRQLLATDISRGGLFLEMESPPELGTAVVIRLDAGATQLLELNARVVHRIPDAKPPRRTGAGVQFEITNDKTRAELQRLIDKAEQLFGTPKP
jgi:hypothetical protein